MTWRSPLAVAALLLSSCGEPPLPTISEQQAASADYWFSRVAENAGRPFHGRFTLDDGRISGEAWVRDVRNYRVIRIYEAGGNDTGLGQWIWRDEYGHGDSLDWASSDLVSAHTQQLLQWGSPYLVDEFLPAEGDPPAPVGLRVGVNTSADYCREVAALSELGGFTVHPADGDYAILERTVDEAERADIDARFYSNRRPEAGPDGSEEARREATAAGVTAIRIGVDVRTGFPVLFELDTVGMPRHYDCLWTHHRFAIDFPDRFFDPPEPVSDLFVTDDESEDPRGMTRAQWEAREEEAW